MSTIVTNTCSKCGAKLFGEEKVCGACMLETALGPIVDDDVDLSVSDRARSQSPMMDFGDYELMEEIGRGGQGVVYRARQKSLNRTVAIKVIGLGHFASTPHLKRFRQEAEAAARLEHSQIVPIYEISERDGSCYFSMKFIEGGQLDQVLKREPMSIRRAVELLVKIARTVQFAHEHGILHRDIKPGNILLDRRGEPHLTDFGLARLIENHSTVTNSFDVLGTPSYMAPEQAAGHAKELTAASDVYSLGAVFYQMLTGQPPFAGGTTYETIRMVMESEPRNPRLWNPKIDVDLTTICLKCLGKEPSKRYASAQELAEDLGRWLRHEPIRARPVNVFTRTRKWIRRNPAKAVLIPSLAAVVVLAFNSFWNRGPAPPPSGIAVLPFENLSGDKTDASFVDGMQDDILTKLAKVGGLKVISRTSVMQYRGERNMRKIGDALGVSHILEGSVRKNGDRIHLNAQLIDARSDSHVWAEQYDRALPEIFAIQTNIAQTIASRLNANVSGAEKTAMEAKPTADLQAYDFYVRGKQLVDRISIMDEDPIQELSEALNLFEKAINRDPGFALAHCGIAEANLRLYWQPAKPAKYRDAAETALNNAMRLAPDAGEPHLFRALFLYWVRLDYDGALAELEIAARLLPNNAQVFRISSWIERRLGRWRESVRHCAKAVELDPRDSVQREDLIRNYMFVRRYSDAVRVADQAILAFSDKTDHFQALKASALLNEGDLKGARRAAESWSPSMELTVDKFLLWFNTLLYERNYAEAERYVANRSELKHHEWLVPDSYFEGVIARARNDNGKATAAFTRCRQDLEAQIEKTPNMGIWISTLGLIEAALGHKEESLRANTRALELSDSLERSQFALDRSMIYCWLGDKDSAVNELEKLVNTEIGVSYGDLRFNPAWDSLRDDPRFAKVLSEAAKPLPLATSLGK